MDRRIKDSPPNWTAHNCPLPADGSVSFEDVWFGYGPLRPPALRGVSFEIEAGRTVALAGRSGAGKSACAHLLARLWDVAAGQVRIGGVDVRDLPLDMLWRQVAIIPQDFRLLDESIAANIRLSRPDATQGEIEEAARLAQAHDFISRLPNGYRSSCGRGGAHLSGGERQRIAIARALLSEAPVLILDEATSHLDAETEHGLQAAMARLRRDRTVLLIAHRLSTLQAADWIVVLENGRVVEEGEHDRLVRWNDRYARLTAPQRAAA